MYKEISDAIVGVLSPINNNISSMITQLTDTPNELVACLALRDNTTVDVNIYKRTSFVEVNGTNICFMITEGIDDFDYDVVIYNGKLLHVYRLPVSLTENRDINDDENNALLYRFIFSVYTLIYIDQYGNNDFSKEVYCGVQYCKVLTCDIVIYFALALLYLDVVYKLFVYSDKNAIAKKAFEIFTKCESEGMSLAKYSEESFIHFIKLLDEVGIEKLLDQSYIVGDTETFTIVKDSYGNERINLKGVSWDE